MCHSLKTVRIVPGRFGGHPKSRSGHLDVGSVQNHSKTVRYETEKIFVWYCFERFRTLNLAQKYDIINSRCFRIKKPEFFENLLFRLRFQLLKCKIVLIQMNRAFSHGGIYLCMVTLYQNVRF